MAKEIDVRLLAEEFIQTYLKEIRHLSSLFSYRDWGFLPIYWFHPVKIEIIHTESDDIAIKLGDIAKAKKDLLKIVEIRLRLEDSQFPNLNYMMNFLSFQFLMKHIIACSKVVPYQ
jgi:hypothetical protein